MSVRVAGPETHFLSLQTAIFCVQCELISANNTPSCLACGSRSVLSLSRLFGGSLRAQPAARLIEDDELNRLVRELLGTLPAQDAEPQRSSIYAHLPARHHARIVQAESGASHDRHLSSPPVPPIGL